MNKKTFIKFTQHDLLVFGILILFSAVTMLFKLWLGILQVVLTAAFAVYLMFVKKHKSELLYNHLQSITLYLDEASKESLTRFPMPVTLLDKHGDIIWYNDLFHSILEQNKIAEVFGKNIDTLCPHISINNHKQDVSFLSRHYSIFTMHQGQKNKDDFYLMYWIDNTDTKNELSRLRSQELCTAHILVDSFDELPTSIPELQKSIFLTRVDVKVRAFVKSIDGVMQKLGQDKYLVLFERKHLQTLEKSKFRLLGEVKEILVEGLHATLSIGVGYGDGSPFDSDKKARKALDTALSRGGDQAVMLIGDKYSFFGGNSDSVGRRKRVKVRIIAETLMAHVQSADNVVIMGHKFADLDCVGSQIGIAKCVQMFGKSPYIVYNPKENLASNIYDVFLNDPAYENVFVEVGAANRLATDNSLLIIADTHNLEYVESEKLYSAFKKVVVIDHHRKTVHNAIEDTVLSFHEPNSSSCCEMVSELCENVHHLKLSKNEANALMSGIFLDTKMFTERTGARTFEAAAYLKKQGADTTEVKNYFKNDIESYKKQIDIISDTQIIDKKFAVSVWNDEQFDGIKLIASKAADEMLNLNEVECSYVIYPEDNDAHISARGCSGANVQRQMERMGGGGHRSAAGAQLKDTSVEDAYDMLIEILKNPESEEEI